MPFLKDENAISGIYSYTLGQMSVILGRIKLFSFDSSSVAEV
jgi:hypothetical protein